MMVCGTGGVVYVARLPWTAVPVKVLGKAFKLLQLHIVCHLSSGTFISTTGCKRQGSLAYLQNKE